MNPAIALDKLAALFCVVGATAFALAVLAVVLLWLICETERSRLRGRPWRDASSRQAAPNDRPQSAG